MTLDVAGEPDAEAEDQEAADFPNFHLRSKLSEKRTEKTNSTFS